MVSISFFRKEFSLNSFLSLSLLFAALIIISCDETSDVVNISNAEKYDAALNSKATFTVREVIGASNGKFFVKLPENVFIPLTKDIGKNTVMKKIFLDGKPYIKTVFVNVVAIEDNHRITEGVEPGDIIFLNPQILIPEMANIDRQETKARFRRTRYLR